jgi:hypothetical protein
LGEGTRVRVELPLQRDGKLVGTRGKDQDSVS